MTDNNNWITGNVWTADQTAYNCGLVSYPKIYHLVNLYTVGISLNSMRLFHDDDHTGFLILSDFLTSDHKLWDSVFLHNWWPAELSRHEHDLLWDPGQRCINDDWRWGEPLSRSKILCYLIHVTNYLLMISFSRCTILNHAVKFLFLNFKDLIRDNNENNEIL